MKMISITEDGGLLASEPFQATEYINMTLATQLNIFNDIVRRAEERGDAEETKAFLYDTYNAAASAFLEVFAPEIELRPDLTAEAILEMENNLINEKAATLTLKEQLDELRAEREDN